MNGGKVELRNNSVSISFAFKDIQVNLGYRNVGYRNDLIPKCDLTKSFQRNNTWNMLRVYCFTNIGKVFHYLTSGLTSA